MRMTVDVQYVNFPKPNGKYGSLRLRNGAYIQVPPGLLDRFRGGMVCEIDAEQETWGRGTPTERQVTVARSGPVGGQNSPSQGHVGGSPYQRPVSRETPYAARTGFQRPSYSQGGPVGAGSSKDERMIFITGVVGRAMGSGKFSAAEVPVLAQAAAAAFAQVTGAGPAPVEDSPYQPQQGAQEPPPPEMGDPGPQEPG